MTQVLLFRANGFWEICMLQRHMKTLALKSIGQHKLIKKDFGELEEHVYTDF